MYNDETVPAFILKHVPPSPLRDSLVLTKSGPAEFRFRLAGVQLSDRGYYWCDITAWTKQPGQAWTRATSAESNKIKIDFQENGGCAFVLATLHYITRTASLIRTTPWNNCSSRLLSKQTHVSHLGIPELFL